MSFHFLLLGFVQTLSSINQAVQFIIKLLLERVIHVLVGRWIELVFQVTSTRLLLVPNKSLFPKLLLFIIEVLEHIFTRILIPNKVWLFDLGVVIHSSYLLILLRSNLLLLFHILILAAAAAAILILAWPCIAITPIWKLDAQSLLGLQE